MKRNVELHIESVKAMELKNFIEMGEKAAGTQKKLALLLDTSDGNLRAAKAGKRGISNKACYVLADLIDEDVTAIIAASELVTEKKPEAREFWEKKLMGMAASFVGFVCFVTMIVTSTTTFSNENKELKSPLLSIMYIM